jgi:DNA replication protein DnaC
MENQEPAGVSGQDKSSLELKRIIEERRAELGIKPGGGPAQVTNAMPDRELSAEEVAARDEANARMALAEQNARRQGLFAVLCEKAGSRYAGCSFKNFACRNKLQEAARDACVEYAKTLIEQIADCRNLVLYGPVGTGKDHLAFSIAAAAALHHGKSVGWINGQDWFGELRDEMSDNGETERRILLRLCAPDVFVVSDPLPPYGSLSQHQGTMLYRLINARYRFGKPTIVTVNVADDEEAYNRLGAATWDRLRDKAWQIHCNWPSFRKPARIINGK